MTRRWRTRLSDLAGSQGRRALLQTRSAVETGVYRGPLSLACARARRPAGALGSPCGGPKGWARTLLGVYSAALQQFDDPRLVEAATLRTLAALRGGSPGDERGERERLAVRALLRQDGCMFGATETAPLPAPLWLSLLRGEA